MKAKSEHNVSYILCYLRDGHAPSKLHDPHCVRIFRTIIKSIRTVGRINGSSVAFELQMASAYRVRILAASGNYMQPAHTRYGEPRNTARQVAPLSQRWLRGWWGVARAAKLPAREHKVRP